jgi:tetratricopeptide (TPR) repeat protein
MFGKFVRTELDVNVIFHWNFKRFFALGALSIVFATGAFSPVYSVGSGELGVLDTSPMSPELKAELDKLQAEADSQKFSEASVNRLAELVAKNPGNARAHLLYGMALDFVGLADQALEQFQLADKYGPQDPRAIVGVISHLLSTGDASSAKGMLETALKRFPKDARVLYVVGRNLMDTNHLLPAETIFWRAYNLSDPSNRPLGLAASMAIIYANNKPDLALRLANEDLAKKPEYYLALEAKGRALANMGLFSQAIEPFSKVYAKNPLYSNIAQSYTRCLFWNGDMARALEPGLYFLAMTARNYGEELMAQKVLESILKPISEAKVETTLADFYKNVPDAQVIRPAFHIYLARSLAVAGKYNLALGEIDKYLKGDPGDFDALFFKAKLLELHLDRADEAYAIYKLCHAILPYEPHSCQALNRLEEELSARKTDWAYALRQSLKSISR